MTAVPPHALLHGLHGRGRGGLLGTVSFRLPCAFSFEQLFNFGQDWAEDKGGITPSRKDSWTETDCVYRHDL